MPCTIGPYRDPPTPGRAPVQGPPVLPLPTPSSVQGSPGGWLLKHIQWTSGRHASYWNAFLLPPANEVWAKVMFLHLCVILFTGGRGSAQPPCRQTPCRQTWGGGWADPLDADHPRQTPPPRYVNKRGYASYWNAYLLIFLPVSTVISTVRQVTLEHFIFFATVNTSQ